MLINIKIVSGMEGKSIYINDYRVVGPKPWGSGKVLIKKTITLKDLQKALPKLEIKIK